MIDIVHSVECAPVTDMKILDKKQSKLNQMWSDEYQQQMKKMAQKQMLERRKVKVQVVEQPKIKVDKAMKGDEQEGEDEPAS